MTRGTRWWSGKVGHEYFDQLSEIWKESPATEQLKFGISSNGNEGSAPSTPLTIDDRDLKSEASLEKQYDLDESIESIIDNDEDTSIAGMHLVLF